MNRSIMEQILDNTKDARNKMRHWGDPEAYVSIGDISSAIELLADAVSMLTRQVYGYPPPAKGEDK